MTHRLQRTGESRTGRWLVTIWLGSILMSIGLEPPVARGNNNQANQIVQTSRAGPVNVTTTLAPREPIIGDEITLEIRVEAEADVEVILPEYGDALQRFAITNFAGREKVESDGTQIFTQNYTLQPSSSGAQSIPQIAVEFVDHRSGKKPAPDDFDAYELLTERIDFEVKSVLPDNASGELKPPLGELELSSSGKTWGATPWIITGLLTVLIVVAIFMFLSGWRRTAQRRNAYEIARARIDRLLQDQQSSQPRMSIETFFVEISDTVRKYLEHRFDLRAPDLTTDEFLKLSAEQTQLTREHQSLLREFLQQADMVKFAGVGATQEDVRHSSELALEFLEDTRENAPEVEESEPDDGLSAPASKENARV